MPDQLAVSYIIVVPGNDFQDAASGLNFSLASCFQYLDSCSLVFIQEFAIGVQHLPPRSLMSAQTVKENVRGG